MLDEGVQGSLNGLLNGKLYSAYVYFGASNYFTRISMEGFSNWLLDCAKADLSQACEISKYNAYHSAGVDLAYVEAPPANFTTALVALAELRRHEERIGGILNDLLSLALAKKDHTTFEFLCPALKAQLAQEAALMKLEMKVKNLCEVGGNLYLLDYEMSRQSIKSMP